MDLVAEDIWGVEEYQEEAEELGERVVYVCIRCGRQYTVDELIQAGLGYVCQTCNSRIFIKPRGSTGTVKPKRVWAV